LKIDSFGAGTTGVSEVGVIDIFSTKTVDVQNLSEFYLIIPPNGAAFLQFDDYRQPYKLKVGAKTFSYPTETHHHISIQISDKVVVTKVFLVRVVASKAAVQFPIAISKSLPHADKAIFVEDQERARVLSIFGEHLCHYSPFRIQDLQRQLAESVGSGSTAVTRGETHPEAASHRSPLTRKVPRCQVL
jgi:hypothetical protein